MEYKIELPIGIGEIDFSDDSNFRMGIRYDFKGPDGRFYIRTTFIFEDEFDQYSQLLEKAFDRYEKLKAETPEGIYFEERFKSIKISNKNRLENGLTLYSSPFSNDKFPITDRKEIQIMINTFNYVRTKFLELSLIEGNNMPQDKFLGLLERTKIEDEQLKINLQNRKQKIEENIASLEKEQLSKKIKEQHKLFIAIGLIIMIFFFFFYYFKK